MVFNTIQNKQIETSSILDTYMYLDKYASNNTKIKYIINNEMGSSLNEWGKPISDMDEFQTINSAINVHSEFGELMLIHQSGYDGKWTDDDIQAAVFQDADGNIYVSFRGTGGGRWVDNGEGMVEESTKEQDVAKAYFDEMAEKFNFKELKAQGKTITVTGHSQGGNRAQFVTMSAENSDLIDSCYSFDGQGFSDAAIEHFKEINGDNFNDQLYKMYSICGENDFVHDLGNQIIPEDNTYFVPTSEGTLGASFHAIQNMIGHYEEVGEYQEYHYNGIRWADINNGHGQQGPIGELAKTLSHNMMMLDKADLSGAAKALMFVIDYISCENKEYFKILSDEDISVLDFLDLLADGVPVVIDSVVQWVIQETLEEFGPAGLVGAFLGLAILFGVIMLSPVAPLVEFMGEFFVTAEIFIKLFDTFSDILQNPDFSDSIKNFFSNLTPLIQDVFSKIEKIGHSLWGVSGWNNTSYLKYDTTLLKEYASRLSNIQSRLQSIDSRLDSLYSQVGLVDLLNLVIADYFTGYNWKLNRCIVYLNDTANELDEAEYKIVNN